MSKESGQSFYPDPNGKWLGRSGETKNSFASFQKRAAAAWKTWGRSHFERHHKGTYPVKSDG